MKRFHIHVSVHDLSRVEADYAKWMLEEVAARSNDSRVRSDSIGGFMK
jgi:hypothetical protein